MARTAQQVALMEQAEQIFDRAANETLPRIERDLKNLGFVQRGGDPAVVMMEHKDTELLLAIELDEDGKVHGYELLPFEEVEQKQEKFRW